jgi:hypothetical protein
MNPARPTSTTLFLSHGGGPLPLLGDPDHQKMVGALRGLAHAHCVCGPGAAL